MKSLALILLASFIAPVCLSDVTRVYDNKPLSLTLPINQEVRVVFPQAVTIQIQEETAKHLVSSAPNQEMVYWTARDAFDRSRVIATAVDGSMVYLIDLQTAENASKESIVIEDAGKVLAQKKSEMQSAASESRTDDDNLQDPPEIILTRFASQSLYAPSRLLPKNPSINHLNRVEIDADFPLLESQEGEHYRLSVVGAWAGYGRYITAILVVNQSPLRIAINPGLVRGNFSHITPQHLYLGPKGSLEDRTTLYLISDKPFQDALVEDAYGY